MKKRYVILFLLIVFGVVIAVYFSTLSKTTSKSVREILPETIPRMPIVETPPQPRKRVVLGLDNLGVIKNLEKNRAENVDASKTGSLKNNLVSTQSDEKFTIYKNGRLKIKGSAGLSEPPNKFDSLDELKDKVTVNGSLTVDF